MHTSLQRLIIYCIIIYLFEYIHQVMLIISYRPNRKEKNKKTDPNEIIITLGSEGQNAGRPRRGVSGPCII